MTPNAVATLMSDQYFELHRAFLSSVINMKTTFPFHSFTLISCVLNNFFPF